MTKEQMELLQEPAFHWFHEISQVPRPSMQETQISAWLLHWAQDRGLEAVRDESNNVFIRKAASSGYENAPAVMLQAHMDMVCEKAPGVEHDFLRDPIQWQIEGDRITTGGRTTLGADDGMGVALALAVLDDDTLPHPPLEVLFTTAEEEDFSGAANFDTARMAARRLINLDHACDKQVLCGSCGGMAVEFTAPVAAEPVPAGWRAYTLNVSGLHGGHSGEDIHRGHGSAVTLLARAIAALEAAMPLKLGPVTGGTFRLAIPREGWATVLIPAESQSEAEDILAAQQAEMAQEFAITGHELSVTLEPTECPDWCAPAQPLLDGVFLMPDGIFQMNEALVGLVDTSDNLGELYLTRGELRMVLEVRSARPSVGNYLLQWIDRLARILGGTWHADRAYPSWDFHPESPLRSIAGAAYERLFGSQPEYLTVHAGLETGFFSVKLPDLDAISIGPDCWNFHSPSEQMSISSTRRVYQFLCEILAQCQS